MLTISYFKKAVCPSLAKISWRGRFQTFGYYVLVYQTVLPELPKVHPLLNCWSWSFSCHLVSALILRWRISLSLTLQMEGSHVYSNSSFGEVNECMSQLDWLNNKIVRGACNIVPNVKYKPKIKFREFLTTWTCLNSFWSLLFISLCPSIEKKAWLHIFPPRNLYHHCMLTGHLIHLLLI